MHLGSTEEAGHQPEWARPAAADIPEISSPKQTAAKTTPYKVASGPTESKTQARGAPTTGGAPTAQPVLGKVCVLLSSEKQIALSSESGGDEYTAEAGLSVSSLLSIHRAVRNSGYTLAFVTPSGAPPPMASCGSLEDLGSCLLGEKDVDTSELLQLLQQSQQLRKVAAAGAEDYSCLLLPHHLGAAVDLLKSSSTSVLLRLFVAAQKPVGVVGYGGFCLCSKRPSASVEGSSTPSDFLFSGYLMSTISVAEEARHPYFGLLPLHLELYLAAEGARVCGAADEGVGVVVDRGLVTTANENSTELLVRTLLLLCSMKQQQQQQQRRQQREGAPYVS